MRSNDVKEYLKTQFTEDTIKNGSIGEESDNYISVFVRPSGTSEVIAVGGTTNTSYNVIPISILVHWNKNYDESDKKATEVYETLQGKFNMNMGSAQVRSVFMLDSYPRSVGRTEKGYCEFVVRCNIYYER